MNSANFILVSFPAWLMRQFQFVAMKFNCGWINKQFNWNRVAKQEKKSETEMECNEIEDWTAIKA